MGPVYSADHRDSPVAVRFQVVDALIFRVVQFLQVAETAVIPQLQFITVSTLFVTQMLIPMVLATMESPQLRVDGAADAPVMQVVQVIGVPFATQRSIPMVLVTWRFPVAADKVVDFSVVKDVQISLSWFSGIFPWSDFV